MPLTSMTTGDLMLLRQFRIERLGRLFAQSLMGCIISLDQFNVLTINCPDGRIIGCLMNELEDLCNFTWLIMGVETIALYVSQQEVCRIQNCRSYSAARLFCKFD
jgi:hypothetical protein